MRGERRLVSPEFECDELVGVQGTLKNLELLTAGFLLHRAAALSQSLGEFGTLPRPGIRGDGEADRHGLLLSYRLIISYRVVSRVSATASSDARPRAQGMHTRVASKHAGCP
jgi:hypothetical protein